jgi:C_GCAxxG_C_C family probable redox protein
MLSVYGKYFGLPEETAVKIAAGFGGGMAHLGETCGAVTGAILVLGGLAYEPDKPDARPQLYSLIQEFTKRFIARNGSICCTDLLGHDMSTEEGLSAVREQKLVPTLCPKFDKCAAELIEEIIAEKRPHISLAEKE